MADWLTWLRLEPKLIARVNPAEQKKPVEIEYGRIKARVSVAFAIGLASRIKTAVRKGRDAAVLFDRAEDPDDVVVDAEDISMLLNADLGSQFADSLERVAEEAACLTHPSGLWRRFSNRFKQ
jgi:hypothetical protein